MSKDTKYIGMDVHQATISIAVLNQDGKLVMESVIETQAAVILDFLRGLRGYLEVTFEESTPAAWLYALLRPHVAKLIVCDARKSARLSQGNKSDKTDARILAELLRAGLLSPVYHADNGSGRLKELAGSYAALTQDTTRTKSRLKALYRGRGISCANKKIYTKRHRSDWLTKLPDEGVLRRAQRLYQELDALEPLRAQASKDMVTEARTFNAYAVLRSLRCLGPIRISTLLAQVQTPHRFRAKRQFWAYCGLALVTRGSAQYQMVAGEMQRAKKATLIRGLNRNHNHDLKNVFKGAAMQASQDPGPLQQFYLARLANGMKPDLARLTLARKIAAIALHLWKKGERFEAKHLTSAAA
jgi:transposase